MRSEPSARSPTTSTFPQHVLRFWETRFTQIKPMKRSGGRRYYRPDDVDLLRGIRRLLYGEGYTIRGVQRILKEHGIASVQRLADASNVASFGAIEEAVGRSLSEKDEEVTPGIDLDDDDYEPADGIDFRLLDARRGRQASDAGPIRRRRPRHAPARRRPPAERAGRPDRLPGTARLRDEGRLGPADRRNRRLVAAAGPTAPPVSRLARGADRS